MWGYGFALSSPPWLSCCRVDEVGEGEGGGRVRARARARRCEVGEDEGEGEREGEGVLSRCRVVCPRPHRREVGENEGEVRARAHRPVVLLTIVMIVVCR